VRQHVKGLEHKAQLLAAQRGAAVVVEFGQRAAGQPHIALIDRLQPGDGVEQRALAHARFAQQRHELAGRVVAFAPGLDPASIAVDLDRGVLSLSGERAPVLPARSDEKTALHLNERFAGRFRRVVSLPDDIDPQGVTATYREGVLRITVPRRAAPQPRRIEVQ
jgi:HSP20 family molecular chaperone IbpA